jgi:hypothetical protein
MVDDLASPVVMVRLDGQPGEFLPPQPCRPAAASDGGADRFRRDAVAPLRTVRPNSQRCTSSTVPVAAPLVLALAVLRKPDDCLSIRRHRRLGPWIPGPQYRREPSYITGPTGGLGRRSPHRRDDP